MAYKEDAIDLIKESKNILAEIKTEYEEALHDQEIKPKLLIKIKNFMENLRSALDFTAHHLFDTYGTSTSANLKVYFPYAWSGLDLNGFRTRNIIENKIPGLIANRPDIADDIESYQHFTTEENSWLPKFMDLNNENKHQRLTPQTRKEVKQLNIKSGDGGTSMSLGEGTSISIGPGAFIQMGDTIIPGGQTFDAGNPPKTIGGAKEVITWVSFEFEDLNEPAFPFLEMAMGGCEKIVIELTSK